MKNEIIEIDGVEFDENLLELNNKGASPYLGVFWDNQKRIYGANHNMAEGAFENENGSFIISEHEDPREAAFFYHEFMKNETKHGEELVKLGSRNWSPAVPTPKFEYPALGLKDNVAKLADIKATRQIKHAAKFSLEEVYTTKNSVSLLRLVSGREAWNVVLAANNIKSVDLDSTIKGAATKLAKNKGNDVSNTAEFWFSKFEELLGL
jgi:hypothetical protein